MKEKGHDRHFPNNYILSYCPALCYVWVALLSILQDIATTNRTPIIKIAERLTDSWGHHPFIVVGVDAHVVCLEVEGVLAVLHVLQLVLVEIGPAPEACVNHMGETFSPSYL